MRLLLAMLKHETNTFSPVPTDLARFEAWGLARGTEVVQRYRGTNHPIAAYLDLAEQAGAEIVTPLAAEAMPSGPVQRGTYEALVGAILDAAEGDLDAAMLDLHGAMVAEHEPDGEGGLLARLRALKPDLPIAVTCDLHCNLTQRMVEHCTALIGYKTYPHIDMYACGEQVGRIVLRALVGEVDPVIAWGSRPLLAQTLRMGTDDQPMAGLIEQARALEAEGALAATLFGGFPMADIAEAGLSALVIADGAQPAAEAGCDRLLDAAWRLREDFVYRPVALQDALQHAKTLSDGPVLLLDHADNCGSGGTQDVMTVVEAVRAAGLRDVAVAAVWDPEAVQQMRQAGLGATVTVVLGGKTAMPDLDLAGRPLELTGTVMALSDGEWVVRGPMYTGSRVSTGPTAVLQAGSMKIVVVSRHHEPWDLGIFTNNGIDPANTRYLLLKSRIHYRAGFGPLARHTITCDGEGVTTSDNSVLRYRNLRRPIYPLDDIA